MTPTCPACHAAAMPGDRHCASCGTRLPTSTPDRRATTDTDYHPLPLAPEPPPPAARGRLVTNLIVIVLALVGGMAAGAYAVSELGGREESPSVAVALDDAEDQPGAADACGTDEDRGADGDDACGQASHGAVDRTATPESPTTPAASPPPSASPAATPEPSTPPVATPEPPASPTTEARTFRMSSVTARDVAYQASTAVAKDAVPVVQAIVSQRYPGDGTGGSDFHAGV